MANSPDILTERDQELLSAYVDGELEPRARRLLEQRLQREPALRAALDDLQRIRALLRHLPRLRAPRDFTLDPSTYARRVPWWRRLATSQNLLQVSGALGASASVVLIVLGLAMTRERPAQAPIADVALAPSPAVPLATDSPAPTLESAPEPQGTVDAAAAGLTAQESARDDDGGESERIADEAAAASASEATSLMAPPAVPAAPMEEALREAPFGADDGYASGIFPEADGPPGFAPGAADGVYMEGAGGADEPGSVGPPAYRPPPAPLIDDVLRKDLTAAPAAAVADEQLEKAASAADEPDYIWLAGVGAATLALSAAMWVAGWRRAHRR